MTLRQAPVHVYFVYAALRICLCQLHAMHAEGSENPGTARPSVGRYEVGSVRYVTPVVREVQGAKGHTVNDMCENVLRDGDGWNGWNGWINGWINSNWAAWQPQRTAED